MNREVRKASRRGELWSVSWRRNLVSASEERSHCRQRESPVQKMTAQKGADGDEPTGSRVWWWVKGKAMRVGWGHVQFHAKNIRPECTSPYICGYLSLCFSVKLHSNVEHYCISYRKDIRNIPPPTHAHFCNTDNQWYVSRGKSFKCSQTTRIWVAVMPSTVTTRATWALTMNSGLPKSQWSYYSIEYAVLLLMHVSPKLDVVRKFKVYGLWKNCAVILALLSCLFFIWSTDPFSLPNCPTLVSGGWPL